MWISPRNWGYFAAVLAVLAFLLSWKFFIAPDSLSRAPLYQKTLDTTAANIAAPESDPDQSLRIYGVNVVHTPPFKEPFFGYGIYLGHGAILTAAHVVGRLPSYAKPRVIIAGKDLPAKVLKLGAVDETDLALLAVDQSKLPISLLLRLNPICRRSFQIGGSVIVVYPERVERSRIISPLSIHPEYRARFSTLIDEPQGSGSGVFDAERHCLLGIMSRRISKFGIQKIGPFQIPRPNGWAGYFVPAAAIQRL